MTTGSLGQGTSLACGMALGEKLRGRDARVFLRQSISQIVHR